MEFGKAADLRLSCTAWKWAVWHDDAWEGDTGRSTAFSFVQSRVLHSETAYGRVGG